MTQSVMRRRPSMPRDHTPQRSVSNATVPVRWACLVGVACWALAACATETPSNAELADPVLLQLSDTPVVSIGVVEGDERYQFVRVSSAWRQRDGRIVVLDAGRAALLFFDSAGTYQFEAGGRGRGPGEMQQIATGWQYRGDSIAVYDLMQRRITIYDHDGRYARSFQNPVTHENRPGFMPSQSCCLVRGTLADGSFIGHPPDDIPTGPGPDRFSTFTPWWISPDGTEAHPIATFESALFRHDPGQRSGIRGFATSYSFRYAVANDRLVGGNGFGRGILSIPVTRPPDAEVSVRTDTVPVPHIGGPFTEALQQSYEQALRADYAANRERYEGAVESYVQAYPPTTPNFVNIHGDGAGRVWLERWTPQYGRKGARAQYDLIRPDGTHVGTVDLPPGAMLLWADHRYVILLERDDMDVQYVRIYGVASARRS